MLIADMAQSVERRLGKAEVTGSIPVISLNMQSAVHCVQHFFDIIGKNEIRFISIVIDRDYQWKKIGFFGKSIRKLYENVDFCHTNDTMKGELLWLSSVPKE